MVRTAWHRPDSSSKTLHLFRGAAPLAQRLIYPAAPVGFVSNYNNYFPGWYDGLSVKFDKRLSYGLRFQANYTWSKTLDYVDSMGEQDGSQPTRWNTGRFKGPAGFDVPHRLVFNYVYEEPFTSQNRFMNTLLANWSIAGITQFDSGFVYGVWISQDWANTGTSGRRSLLSKTGFDGVRMEPSYN